MKKKLSLVAATGIAALMFAAVPASIKWSPADGSVFALNTAEARVGRPLTPVSVAGVNRRVDRRVYRRASTGAALEPPWERPLWEALLLPRLPDQRSSPPLLMAGPGTARGPAPMLGRAMATAQDPSRTL